MARGLNRNEAGEIASEDRKPEKQVMEVRQVVDVSNIDDLYEILAGCDAFMTDYSSAAFDAAVMKVPVFLYAEDYGEYEAERGKLLWNLRELPFPLAVDDDELERRIREFEDTQYQVELERLFLKTGMEEDGKAAERVVDFFIKGTCL